jgi:hypothetical protein
MRIIGVDHVQFGVPDPSAGARSLGWLGYRLDFEASGFNTVARPYFRGVHKSMAYLRLGGSRIEMITDGGHAAARHYTPVLDGAACWNGLPALDTSRLSSFWHQGLGCVCAAGAGDGAGLDGVIVRAPEHRNSVSFWQLLGFALTAQDATGARLAFPRNPVSMPLTVCLTPAEPGPATEAKADDAGCASVALISLDLDRDRAALGSAGHKVTETTLFRINGRGVTICFASGPSGELVELLQFERV